MTNLRVFILCAVVVLFGCVTTTAQTTTATLSGRVEDPSEAIVPGVRISARNTQTGAERSTNTDNEGRYSFTGLEPGQYELRAELSGFKTAMQSNVTLTVGGAAVVNLTMQVGDIKEVVEVTQSEQPLIEPTRAELSRVVDERSIDSLPII